MRSIICFTALTMLSARSGTPPTNLSVKNGELAPYPDSPDCVSSFSEMTERKVLPIAANGESLARQPNYPQAAHSNNPIPYEGYQHDKLSDRELQIQKLIASGDSLTEIGEAMFLSVKTVIPYRGWILEKLGTSNNAELIKYAIAHGLTLTPY